VTVILGAVAGCAHAPQPAGRSPGPAAEVLAKPVPPLPKRKPPPPAQPGDMGVREAEPARLEPEPPPVELVGLDAPAIEERLGPPQAQSDSPPAVVWQYAAGDCAVNIYLYREVQSGALRALFVDVKGDDRSDRQRQSCLQRLAGQPAGSARADTPAAR
jgi:hypothetical protein